VLKSCSNLGADLLTIPPKPIAGACQARRFLRQSHLQGVWSLQFTVLVSAYFGLT